MKTTNIKDNRKLMESCCQALTEKNLTIAFAESVTAGKVMANFALMENAGDFLQGGVVCYDASIKVNLLQTPASLIEKHTAESAEVTKCLAEGLAKIIDADIYVAVTGLSKSGGSETAEKPVGTVFIHLLSEDNAFNTKLIFDGTSEEVIEKTVHCIATLLKKYVERMNFSENLKQSG